MPKAYVLINCKTGYETLVSKNIQSIKDNVLTCNIVYGEYDIIVEIKFDTLRQLEYIIQKKIRMINNVTSTMTLIPYN
jgi:DNA-binding Lrp family transcriptional regulator